MPYFNSIKFKSATIPFVKIQKLGTSTAISPVNNLSKISSKTTKIEPKNLETSRTYKNVEYTWSSDFSSCSAAAIQNGTNANISENGTVEILKTIQPTHGEDGSITYAAKFTKKPFELQMKIKTLPAVGHDYNAPTYTWNEEGTVCTAKRTCKDDSAFEEEVGTMTYSIEAATCEGLGHQVATATFENTAFATQTNYYGDIAASGHAYGTPSYSWSADGKTCTATRICTRDVSHVETEVGTTVLSQTDSTCLDTGVKTATASFTNSAFAQQTNDYEVIPAKGHDWATPTYTWSADGKTCTAKRICNRDASHIETEVGVSTYSTVAATSFADGAKKATATFTNSAFSTQTNTYEVIPQLQSGVFDASGNLVTNITSAQIGAGYGCTIPSSWIV